MENQTPATSRGEIPWPENYSRNIDDQPTPPTPPKKSFGRTRYAIEIFLAAILGYGLITFKISQTDYYPLLLAPLASFVLSTLRRWSDAGWSLFPLLVVLIPGGVFAIPIALLFYPSKYQQAVEEWNKKNDQNKCP